MANEEKTKKIQKLVSQFNTETIKIKRTALKKVKDPKTGKEKKITRVKNVEVQATIIPAGVFDEMVQLEFEHKKGLEYSVRLDLWSALQEKNDHVFNVSAAGLATTKPYIDGFKTHGRRVDACAHLLDYFRSKGLVPAGTVVIRFPKI